MSVLGQRSRLAERLIPAKGLFRNAAPPSERARKARLMLHVLPLPILLRGFYGVEQAFAAVAVLGLFFAAIWVLGEGLRAEDHWRARDAAKAPKWRLKLVSAVLMALAVALAFYFGGMSAFGAGLAGILAAVLHATAFGLDPRHDKQSTGVTAFEAERIEGLSEAIEPQLARIAAAAVLSGDAVLRAEARALELMVQARMQAVRADPAATAASRKMVSVWLPALAEALERGVQMEIISHDPERVARLGAAMFEVRNRIEALTEATQSNADRRLSGDLAALREALR